MTHLKTNKLGLAAVVATLGVAGCGGGDSNKTLSYGAFGKQANQICRDSQKKVDLISKDLNGEPANDAPILKKLIPAIDGANKTFEKLKPPAKLKDAVDAFDKINLQQLDLAKTAQTQAEDGDKAAYQTTLQSLNKLGAQNDAAASKLGAADCVSS